MENNNKVSIITPVYKVEKYLSKCIDSILNQTFKNFELILVDDGSPDSCGVICDEYGVKDPRVKVIHKKNGGVSSARNSGLENAIGKWILFVDSDDFLAENALEILVNASAKFKSDLVIFDKYFKVENSTINIVSSQNLPEKIGSDQYLKSLLTYSDPFYPVLWGKLFKHEIIEDKRFDVDVKIGEDLLFQLDLLIQNTQVNIAVVHLPYYYYLIRSDSAMHSLKREEYDLLTQKSFKLITLYAGLNRFKFEFELFKIINLCLKILSSEHGISNEEYLSIQTDLRGAKVLMKELPMGFKLLIFVYRLNRNIGNFYLFLRRVF